MANVVGAPLPQEQVDWKPALNGMGMEKTVVVHNPLKDDFRVQYARSVAAMPGLNPGLEYAREKAGLPLGKSNPQKHVINHIVLKAGQTVNLPGDIAQKAVQDLITYILGVRDKKKISDPHAREEVEKELIISIKDTSEFLNRPTVEEFTEKQLADLNPEPVQEKEENSIPNPPPGQGVSYEPAKS